MRQPFLHLVLIAFKYHKGFVKTICHGAILLLLVTAWGQGFSQTFDPNFAGRISNGDGPAPYLTGINDVYVQGNFAYTAVGNGLEIVDISLPLLPVHRGSLRQADDPAISQFIKIYVKGNYLYAICTNDNFVVIDISNPSAPKRVGYYAFPNNFFIYLGDLFVSGNNAYITSTVASGGIFGGLYVLDISNPLSPQKVGTAATTITGLPFTWKTSFVLNNYCYLASGNNVYILDVTNPASPIQKSSFSLANVRAIYVAGTRAYFVTTNGVSVYDVDLTNPANPSQINSITNGTNNAKLDNTTAHTAGIKINGNYAYVTSYDSSAVEVLDISNVSTVKPPLHVTSLVNGANLPLGQPTSVFLSGNYAYVASSSSSALEVLDISNPALPKHGGSLTKSSNQIIMGQSFSSAVAGNYFFATQRAENAVSVTDISNPQSPAFVSNLMNGQHGAYLNQPLGIAISGNYAYIANRGVDNSGKQASLQILDISDPSNLLPVGKYLSPYPASSVALAGNYAFVLANNGSQFNLIAVDIHNPASPSMASILTTGISTYFNQFGFYNSISISGNYAYIVANGNLIVVDISTPAALTPASIKTTKLIANANFGTVVSNGGKTYVYVVSSTGGVSSTNTLSIVDISTAPSVSDMGTYTNTSYITSGYTTVAAYNNYALLGSYLTNSILVLDVSSALSHVSGPAVTIPPPVSTLSTWGVNNTNSNLNLVHPNYISTSGHYAYVVSNNEGDGHLEILDLYSSQLSSFTPTTGNENSTVTLSGQNFDSFLNVSFNGLPATVTSYTPTQATVTVPVGAKIGPVKIGDRGSSQSSANFIVIPKSSAATSVQQNGFTANWSDVGGAGYSLDVSNDNFSTTITGYNPKALGNVTSQLITGLSAGVNYQYRVRSKDGTTPSGNSNVTNVSTIPATPVLNATTLITQNSFTINWNTIAGATGYYLDVATDAAFSIASTLGSYNNLQVLGNSQSVSGLTPGTIYYFQIRSYNTGGVSPSSTSGTITIIPPNPVAQAATGVGSTGFTAVWSAATGATNYSLDVSTNNFSTFVTKTPGNTLSFAVSALIAGINYQYRLRATNPSGSSGNSSIISVVTLPVAPAVNKPATSITSNSFTVSWSAVIGATSYSADVATDSAFLSLIYNNVTTGSTTYTANSLSATTIYYFRVRANDASGSSSSSGKVTAATLSPAPGSQSSGITFSGVTTNSFTVSFTPGNGASHLMVVNANTAVGGVPNNGTSYIGNTVYGKGSSLSSGFVTGNGVGPITVTGLAPATTYYVQVYDYNGAGVTENYLTNSSSNNPSSQNTVATSASNQPTNLVLTQLNSATAVGVSFSPVVTGSFGYLLLRSSGSAPTGVPQNGTTYTTGALLAGSNATVAAVGSVNAFTDEGLPTATTYFYNVYAFNGSGASVNYNVINPLQGNVTLDLDPPVISTSASPNPATIASGNTPLFNVSITDNVNVATAKIFYRGISQVAFKNAVLSPSGAAGNYSIQIESSWYDSLGLEYYFWASDENGNETGIPSSSEYLHAQLVNPSITLPALPSGSKPADYRIVSFPYVLSTDNKVTTVYNGAPWNDNTKAALWWWDPSANGGAGTYDQYGSGSSLQTVDAGRGYWVIVSSGFSPQLTNAKAPAYNRSHLYPMTLKPKWNQVGNPYPVAISWDDVITLNQQLTPGAQFSTINVYDGSGYKPAAGNTLLKAFEGGFVKNLGTSDITIYIPFNGQTEIGGRIASPVDISEDSWNMFLRIEQTDRANALGGFGMNPQAEPGPDRYDNFNPPRFIEDPEVNFINKDYKIESFSKDIVKTQPEYVWQFIPAGIPGEITRLTWNNDVRNSFGKQLFLLDEEALKMIDMTEADHYQFKLTDKSSFRIFYGTDIQSKVSTMSVTATAPYPNPVANEASSTINLSLPDSGKDYSVNLEVFNSQGELIGVTDKMFSSGTHSLEYILSNPVGAGIYIYKLLINSGEKSKVFTGKIVKL